MRTGRKGGSSALGRPDASCDGAGSVIASHGYGGREVVVIVPGPKSSIGLLRRWWNRTRRRSAEAPRRCGGEFARVSGDSTDPHWQHDSESVDIASSIIGGSSAQAPSGAC